MIPILYRSNEVDFNNNGLGMLKDCSSCIVTEDTDGFFETELNYMPSGKMFNHIVLGAIVKTKPNSFMPPQLFRIYSISKSMDVPLIVNAQHISYDLAGVPVAPFEAKTVKEAIDFLNKNKMVDSKFTFSTDIDLEIDYKLEMPNSARAVFFEISELCNGEPEFNNFNVNLLKKRGIDRGFQVRYGKNMIGLEQNESNVNVINGIFPFWYDGEKLIITPNPVMIEDVDNPVIVAMDFTADFDEKPSIDELVEFAEQYIIDNKVNEPNVYTDVSFAASNENAFLYDDVRVVCAKIGIDKSLKVNKISYDSLAERIEESSLGDIKRSLTNVKE